MKKYILNQSNWKTVKEEKFTIALLPWGATEPHNYHLPYGTDTLQSEKIAEMAASKAHRNGVKCMVLPSIPLGVQNPGQIDYPFCIHTRPTTQLAILQDILTSLDRQKIHKLVIVNSHGGNEFKPIIRELQIQFEHCFIGVIDWFKVLNNEDYFDEPGDHAGEMETSIMQFCYPELVLPLEEAGEGKTTGFKLGGLKSKLVWTPRNWGKVSEDTGVGNPQKASSKKGERFLDVLTDRTMEFLTELDKVNPMDIYQ
ncbi:creatininase family protein [Echinicola strongylocentroti]|uniref:Creatininase family protein n=1 Tax=Echinicola strongylocentroti TaxID=1795355 RepID=A0A2Z4IEZ5_9BACT|nr:creatininase family protein [Echinicola strongylocentroti]AWW29504.1 creatininase family protein [Echinicola strongylocentroti]